MLTTKTCDFARRMSRNVSDYAGRISYVPTLFVNLGIDMTEAVGTRAEGVVRDYSSYYYVRYYQRSVSAIIETFSSVIENSDREIFRTLRITKLRQNVATHTHEASAAVRTELNKLIDEMAADTGRGVWALAKTDYDRRREYSGTSPMHHLKDLTYGYEHANPREGDIVKLSDVDYFIDDLEYMLVEPHTVLIQTFAPQSVAGSIPDGHYRINSDDEVEVTLSSGATYSHKLWNWSTDCIAMRGWFTTTIYQVETIVHPSDATRMLVGLFPRRRVPTILLWWMKTAGLQRRTFAREGWVASKFFESAKDKTRYPVLSFARAGCDVATDIPLEPVLTCYNRWARTKELHTSSIESMIRSYDNEKRGDEARFKSVDSSITASSMLIELFENAPAIMATVGEMCAPSAVRCRENTVDYVPYIQNGPPLLDDAKPSVRDIRETNEESWATSAVAPMRCIQSDLVAVKGRIKDVINNKVPPSRFDGYARKFITRLVRDRKHTLVPADPEVVWEMQNRPSQRAILTRAADGVFNPMAGDAPPFG